jgi:serine/threonine protein kinase
MSPEQCRGIHDEIDHRSDIYSLGILLYEMLCGVTPFVSSGFGDVLLMHMTEAPLPPSARNTLVPPAVEQVILRALAKKPEDRFQTMRELRAALGEDLSAPSMTSVGFGQIAAPERTPGLTPVSLAGRTPPPVISAGAVTEPSQRPVARDADSLVATTPKVMPTSAGSGHGLRKIVVGLAAGGAVLLLALLLSVRLHGTETTPSPPSGPPAVRSISPTITPLPPPVHEQETAPAQKPIAGAPPRAGAGKATATEPGDDATTSKNVPEKAPRPGHGASAGDKTAPPSARRERSKKSTPSPSPPRQPADKLRVDQW